MSDVDPSANARGLAEMVAAETKKAFGDLTRSGALAGIGAGVGATGAPDGNEVLAWLSGNRNPDRRKGLQAPTGAASAYAEETLSQPKPVDPVEAAQKRASILADLHREAPRDPRVRSVFEGDPIVVEDPDNGNLVTESMLRARGDVFDAVLTMLGRSILTKAARSRLRLTLKGAYAMLSDDAQVEWALSEVRLEETKVFLERRSQSDLNALGNQLETILERSDLWSAARTLSIAAHLAVSEQRGSAALSDLLEEREWDDLPPAA